MPELSPKIVGLMSTKLDDGLGMFEFLIGSNEEVYFLINQFEID